MAKANSFDRRFSGAHLRPDAHWDCVIAVDWTHETKFYRQMGELSAYTYEATARSGGMTTPSWASARRISARIGTRAGARFDGGRTYRVRVRPTLLLQTSGH
jgi:hypothetical protein